MAMSFAGKTKAELCGRDFEKECCKRAEVYGFFLFGKHFSQRAVTVTTESLPAARKEARQIAEVAGVIAGVSVGIRRKGREQPIATVSLESGECERALSFFGHDVGDITLRLQRFNLEEECCFSAFLRGAFLSCGTVTQPEKEYRLEFSVPHKNLAGDLALFLRETGLTLHIGQAARRGSFVVYINGAEEVGDLLAYMGAFSSSLELIQAKMLKEVRNNINRKINFESANLDKTAAAAAKQILAIRRIQEAGVFHSLPEDLQRLARLRSDHPEDSLRELGERFRPALSRSGVSRRLNKLLELAENLNKDSDMSP